MSALTEQHHIPTEYLGFGCAAHAKVSGSQLPENKKDGAARMVHPALALPTLQRPRTGASSEQAAHQASAPDHTVHTTAYTASRATIQKPLLHSKCTKRTLRMRGILSALLLGCKESCTKQILLIRFKWVKFKLVQGTPLSIWIENSVASSAQIPSLSTQKASKGVRYIYIYICIENTDKENILKNDISYLQPRVHLLWNQDLWQILQHEHSPEECWNQPSITLFTRQASRGQRDNTKLGGSF